MAGHVTEQDVKDFRENKLGPDELMRLDDHLASCDSCRDRISATVEAATAVGAFARAAQPEGHLSYRQLEGYVDGHLSADELTLVRDHIAACKECSDEANEFRQLTPTIHITTEPLPSWWSSILRPLPSFATIALVIGLVGLIWYWSTRTSKPEPEIAKVETEPQVEQSPPDNTAPLEASPIEQPIVAINDGGQQVGISSTGELTGYDSLAPTYRVLVKDALMRGKIAVANTSDLKGSAGALMGDAGDIGTFRLNGPIGKVVDTTSPALSWQAVPNAESYTVEIYDQNFSKVASSGELKATSWQPVLKRGKVYTWQVTAVAEGKTFKAPTRPAPDARFRVLDEKSSAEIASLKRTGSHLLLGTMYAKAGLIDDAVREFELLAKANPGSELAKKLLRQVRASR